MESIGHILLTSAASKIPLLRALQVAARRLDPNARVIAGDIDPGVPAQFVADGFWQMPRLDTVFPGDIARECHARGIRTILPTRDDELTFWSSTKTTLAEAGIAVIVSDLEAVLCCLDKYAFAEWGVQRNLPVIPAATDAGELGDGPFVAKERFGAGTEQIGLNLSFDTARIHATTLSDPIYQRFVDGPEISIDAWMTQVGAVHGLVLRRRDRIVSGESQVTTTFRDNVLEAQAVKVLSALGLSGPAVMQAIVVDAGLAVIEVNPRFGGASTASLSVGLDMLYWSLLERIDPNCPMPSFARRMGDVRQVRVPGDIVTFDPHL